VEKYAKTSTEDLTPEQGKELLEAFKAWDDPNPPTMKTAEEVWTPQTRQDNSKKIEAFLK
jgi:hypothetical protein